MEINQRFAPPVGVFKVRGVNLPYLRAKRLMGEPLPKLEFHYGIKMKRRCLEMFNE